MALADYIDPDLHALYKARKTAAEESEPDYELAAEAAKEEAARNRRRVASPLGGGAEKLTEKQEELRNEHMKFNVDFHTFAQTRAQLLEELETRAELEYMRAAKELIRAWNSLGIVSNVISSAGKNPHLTGMQMSELFIPAPRSAAMRGHTQICNFKAVFHNARQDLKAWSKHAKAFSEDML